MFTGIIEEIGAVKSIRINGNLLKIGINSKHLVKDLRLGESVCVNGACLTVTDIEKSSFLVDVSRETALKTNLGSLKISENVNLERALKVSDRLSGHIVSGHVDATGTIKSISRSLDAIKITVACPRSLNNYIVNKGSITIDGISLTVSSVALDSFTVNVIPYTINATTIGKKKIADKVNLESDIIGKYVEKMIALPGLSMPLENHSGGLFKNGPAVVKIIDWPEGLSSCN
ncbi:MAG: riboflavin synthase [Candidatus Margulisiibacteriota bacterium]